MALSNQQLQDRVEAIEVVLNDVQTAINNLATKQQLKSLLNIRQTEINDLAQKVVSLESQVVMLQS